MAALVAPWSPAGLLWLAGCEQKGPVSPPGSAQSPCEVLLREVWSPHVENAGSVTVAWSPRLSVSPTSGSSGMVLGGGVTRSSGWGFCEWDQCPSSKRPQKASSPLSAQHTRRTQPLHQERNPYQHLMSWHPGLGHLAS